MKQVTYTTGGRKTFLLVLLSLLLCITLALPVFASVDLSSIDIKGEEQISGDIYDGANLLSDDQRATLSARLAELEELYQCDVAILTLKDANGYDPRDYAEAIYKRCGYGYGPDQDGIMLAIITKERDWQLLTFGYGITAITDYGVDYISERVVSELSDDEYYKAFETFVDLSDAFLKEARTGTPYDVDHPARLTFFSKLLPYLMSFGIAFIVALIICCILAASMKSAAKKSTAAGYMEKGSFHLTKKRDYYLYTTHTRVKHESSSSSNGSSGGSSTDSNGFGGGGGKY